MDEDIYVGEDIAFCDKIKKTILKFISLIILKFFIKHDL